MLLVSGLSPEAHKIPTWRYQSDYPANEGTGRLAVSAMIPDGVGQWTASRWQRAHAAEFAAWRASEHSLALQQLSTLCEAISVTTLSWAGRPSALAPVLPDVLSKCNRLHFDSDAEVAAYTLLHLADRYGRVTQVLERVFAAGHLPIRRRRLSVLEVGAGPTPGLYAAHDFYDDLCRWAETTEQEVELTPVTMLHALDKGAAWGLLLHHLSEHVGAARRHFINLDSNLHYGTRYADLAGFSAREIYNRELSSLTRAIVYEDGDDLINHHLIAQELAQDGGLRVPSAYDVVIACNFFTTLELTERFEAEIRDLGRWLTPGGLLILMGSESDSYSKIWNKMRGILRRARLTPVSGFTDSIEANDDSVRAAVIRGRLAEDLQTIRDDGGGLPEVFDNVDLDTRFPRFRAMVWKNQRPRQAGRTR